MYCTSVETINKILHSVCGGGRGTVLSLAGLQENDCFYSRMNTAKVFLFPDLRLCPSTSLLKKLVQSVLYLLFFYILVCSLRATIQYPVKDGYYP